MSCFDRQYHSQDCVFISVYNVGGPGEEFNTYSGYELKSAFGILTNFSDRGDLLKSGKAVPNKDRSTEFAASTEAAYIV